MQDIYLAKVNPDKNEYRFYRLCLPTNSTDLLQQWGRVGDYIYEKWDGFDSHQAAQVQLEKLTKSKRREGYTLADRSVMPRNHLFYERPTGSMDGDGQLTLFDDV